MEFHLLTAIWFLQWLGTGFDLGRLLRAPASPVSLPVAARLDTIDNMQMRLNPLQTQTVRCRHGTIGGSSSLLLLLPQRSVGLRVRAANESTASQDENVQQAQKDAARASQDREFPKTGLFSIADPNAEVCCVQHPLSA